MFLFKNMLAYKLEVREGLLRLVPQKNTSRTADIHLQKRDKSKHISSAANVDKNAGIV